MHVGRRKIKEICPDLYVDGWKLKEVSEIDTGAVEYDLVDDYDGRKKMDEQMKNTWEIFSLQMERTLKIYQQEETKPLEPGTK